METVHLLWHIRSDDEYGENAKLIGVYRTAVDARGAIERLRTQPGFSDYPSGFEINAYELNKDHWTEGFINHTKQ